MILIVIITCWQYNKQHIIPLEEVKLESLADDGRKFIIIICKISIYKLVYKLSICKIITYYFSWVIHIVFNNHFPKIYIFDYKSWVTVGTNTILCNLFMEVYALTISIISFLDLVPLICYYLNYLNYTV